MNNKKRSQYDPSREQVEAEELAEVGLGETIQTEFRRHWAELLPTFITSFIMALVPILLVFFPIIREAFLTLTPQALAGTWLIIGLIYVFAISFIFMEWLFWYFDLWIVTSERIVDSELENLFNKTVSEMLLTQIQDVKSEKNGFFQTVFNFGDVVCQTAGAKNYFRLGSIAKPEKAVKLILSLREEYMNRGQSGIPQPTEPSSSSPGDTVGDILVREDYITQNQLDQARSSTPANADNQQITQELIDQGLITKQDQLEALGLKYNLPVIDLPRYNLQAEVVKELRPGIARELNIIPVSKVGDTLTLAIPNPRLMNKADRLRQETGDAISFVLADPDHIREAIYAYYQDE